MDRELAKDILTTLAYYDAMDFPMTSFEIWKYLTCIGGNHERQEKYSLYEIVKELEEEKLQKFIGQFQGYFFLKGRDELVRQRIERNKISETKYKIGQKVVFWLRFVPYLRMVAVTGSLSMKNAQKDSDLDFLVVLKHGKIFTGRLLVTLLIHFLGKRRHGDIINNRICLNYFITTNSLDIKLKDVFSASQIAFAVPLFGFKVFRKYQEKNGWVKNYILNFQTGVIPSSKLISDSKIVKIIRKIGESILSFEFIENILEKLQKEKIAKNPKTYQKESIIIADGESLVFLPEPKGPQIFEKFKQKLDAIKQSSY